MKTWEVVGGVVLGGLAGVAAAHIISKSPVIPLTQEPSKNSGAGSPATQTANSGNGNASTNGQSVTTPSPSSAPIENDLYQVNGQPAIYAYQNGTMHYICSDATLTTMGFSYNTLHQVSALPASIGSQYCDTSTTPVQIHGSRTSSQQNTCPSGYFRIMFPRINGQPICVRSTPSALPASDTRASGCTVWRGLGLAVAPSNGVLPTDGNEPRPIYGVAKYVNRQLVEVYGQYGPVSEGDLLYSVFCGGNSPSLGAGSI